MQWFKNYYSAASNHMCTYLHIIQKYLSFHVQPNKTIKVATTCLKKKLYTKHNGIPAHISQKFKDLFILYLPCNDLA